jgi:hypothetical protein
VQGQQTAYLGHSPHPNSVELSLRSISFYQFFVREAVALATLLARLHWVRKSYGQLQYFEISALTAWLDPHLKATMRTSKTKAVAR